MATFFIDHEDMLIWFDGKWRMYFKNDIGQQTSGIQSFDSKAHMIASYPEIDRALKIDMNKRANHLVNELA